MPKPITIYVVNYYSHGDPVDEYFPTKKESYKRFRELKLDADELDFTIEWDKLLVIPLTKRNLCQILSDGGFVLKRESIAVYEFPDNLSLEED